MATCSVNGVPARGAICGAIKCNSNECGAEPNSCEHQSDYTPPEYGTLQRIANGEIEYFMNTHIIKLLASELITTSKPSFVITDKGREALNMKKAEG